MRRGKERWTHADDERLSRALLAVFANRGEPVVLSDNCALWKRVQQRYQELMAADATAAARSARSLHTRWARGIRPDLTLFASLVQKTQRNGADAVKAVEMAVRLFREQRSEANAAAVRQFVQKRQRTSLTGGDVDADSETDCSRPKLKFESFHFLHCYDILGASPTFLKVLLDPSRTARGDGAHDKRRRVDAGSALKREDSASVDAQEDGKRVASASRAPPARRVQGMKMSSTQSKSRTQQQPPSGQQPQRRDEKTRHSFTAARRDSSRAVVTLDDASDDIGVPPVECDRAVANEYVRLRIQTLREDRRLKLLAELRGVVATIAQLAQQLAWDGVASAAVAARTGKAHVASNSGVLRDIAFFRHEKQRLKQRIAGLDDGAPSRDRVAQT
ncbi:unnamed protein product [Hyaloperonospora brassicae]|uniref:Myb-like domain-containing protein n=1 Tax=Hyaloperonospora brassicae TaxID=162125 RepID=A0AAV0UHI9_HYABA|nr:unnamed protein product [Hyaloperonospora brassicae]